MSFTAGMSQAQLIALSVLLEQSYKNTSARERRKIV